MLMEPDPWLSEAEYPQSPLFDKIQAEQQSRRAGTRSGVRERLMGRAGPGAANALEAYLASNAWRTPGMGLGPVISGQTDKLAAGLGGTPHLAGAAKFGGRALAMAPALLGTAAAVAPVAMSAMDGYNTAGVGGAGLSGGGAAAGALAGGIAFGLPGALIGGAIGGFGGNLLTRGASAAALAADEGDTGPVGGLGEMAKAIGVESPYQAEERAIRRVENSPAMQAIRQEEALRAQKARTQAMEALYMQSLLA